MKAGFIQFNPEFGKIDTNMEKASALIRNAEADLLVLPELFNTGYLLTSREEAGSLAEEIPNGKTTAALGDIARERNVHIAAGLIERSGDKIFNSAVLVSPSGYRATYRKIHLFSEEKIWFDPGDVPFEVHDIGSCRVGIMICFDWFFPESMRILALKGADVVCHCANLVLPFCQEAMITRCLENQVFAVTANRTGAENRGGKFLRYTGRSQIAGPGGRILYRAGADDEEAGTAEFDHLSARNKSINRFNDLLKDRRSEFYADLVSP